MSSILHIHNKDNVAVALQDLTAGEVVEYNGETLKLQQEVNAKHKISLDNLNAGDQILMYGVPVAKAKGRILKGEGLTVNNVENEVEKYQWVNNDVKWEKPDISKFQHRTFDGFHRKDGKVGTANHWLVIPLVFCENRNVETMKKAMLEQLGYEEPSVYTQFTKDLIKQYKGVNTNGVAHAAEKKERIFPNVDGIKFLTHQMGCGGTRSDAQALCGLIAGYITNANTAGATILSLGCQNAQIDLLKEELAKRNWNEDQKPVFFVDQQQIGSEEVLIKQAIELTFSGLVEANKIKREPASLSHLCLGLECGGSDGFSGISANPVLGYTSDLLVALGGVAVLSEFPELNGAEQDLLSRCQEKSVADRFIDLMERYEQRAHEVGSGFYMNPSPGNIKDGLLTDAMKSAGAAKKGGTSPVVDVLDYPEQVKRKGLNLLCTPGNDVESTTGMVGAGCNMVVFTTGLGTPTGNPISPVIKMATNSKMATKMSDIIDIDAGVIIRGEKTIQELGEELLDLIIATASGTYVDKATAKNQNDFIPWKRGVSL